MKAHVTPVSPDTITVRGVELSFNGFNENHLRRWQDVGADVEKKYPGAMDLSANLDDVGSYTDIIEKYADGTKAFCELFDGVFGEGTSAALFGDEPYYGLCLETYYEFLAGVERQGAAYGQRIVKTLNGFNPVGPKGAKQ